MPRNQGRSTPVLLTAHPRPRTDGKYCVTGGEKPCEYFGCSGCCALVPGMGYIDLRREWPGGRWLRCAACKAAERRWREAEGMKLLADARLEIIEDLRARKGLFAADASDIAAALVASADLDALAEQALGIGCYVARVARLRDGKVTWEFSVWNGTDFLCDDDEDPWVEYGASPAEAAQKLRERLQEYIAEEDDNGE